MNEQSAPLRIRNLYQMLFEMATGNLAFRIDQSDQDDELDTLGAILNPVAAGMQSKILNSGFVNPYYSYQNLIQTTFVLDKNFRIQSFSADLPTILGHQPDQLFKMNFDELLATAKISLRGQHEQ